MHYQDCGWNHDDDCKIYLKCLYWDLYIIQIWCHADISYSPENIIEYRLSRKIILETEINCSTYFYNIFELDDIFTNTLSLILITKFQFCEACFLKHHIILMCMRLLSAILFLSKITTTCTVYRRRSAQVYDACWTFFFIWNPPLLKFKMLKQEKKRSDW